MAFRCERESPASPARKTTRGSAYAAKLGKERGSLGGEKQFDFSTKIVFKVHKKTFVDPWFIETLFG